MTKVIAIDGTAASGKGTLSRKLAANLDFDYLDTGLLYRAVGFEVSTRKIKISDKDSILKCIEEMKFDNLDDPRLLTMKSGAIASKISIIPEVRAKLVDSQRNFPQGKRGAVIDGRDIGTVIFPDADIKIFITADVTVRAERRYKQLQDMGKSVIYEHVLEELRERDSRDSNRKIAPLRPADDAVILDTTNLSAQSVLELAVALTKNFAVKKTA